MTNKTLISLFLFLATTLVVGGVITGAYGIKHIQDQNKALKGKLSDTEEKLKSTQIVLENRITDDTKDTDHIQTEAEREAIAKRLYDEARVKWLKENPPVDVLYVEKNGYNTEYVINYLKRNKISGHCALVWRPDVVCMEGFHIVFPSSRE